MKNAAPNSIAGASTLTGLSKGSGSGTSAMPTIYVIRRLPGILARICQGKALKKK